MRAAARPSLALLAAWLCASPLARAETGGTDALAAFAGRELTAIVLVGYDTTRDEVIRREVESRVGEPLSLESVAADVQRLDNLQIFAEIVVSAEADGDGARLTFRFKEMPP